MFNFFHLQINTNCRKIIYVCFRDIQYLIVLKNCQEKRLLGIKTFAKKDNKIWYKTIFISYDV